MKQLEVFLLHLDMMLIHHRSLPCSFFGFPQQFSGVDRKKTESNQSCTCTVFMYLTCKFNLTVTVSVHVHHQLLNPQYKHLQCIELMLFTMHITHDDETKKYTKEYSVKVNRRQTTFMHYG